MKGSQSLIISQVTRLGHYFFTSCYWISQPSNLPLYKGIFFFQGLRFSISKFRVSSFFLIDFGKSRMKESKSGKLNQQQQQQQYNHQNVHLSPSKLANFFDPDASWDKVLSSHSLSLLSPSFSKLLWLVYFCCFSLEIWFRESYS